jgi:hypothetical protein
MFEPATWASKVGRAPAFIEERPEPFDTANVHSVSLELTLAYRFGLRDKDG